MEGSSSSALESSATAECPVCHKMVVIETINSHIDGCLGIDTFDFRRERKRHSSLASFVSSKAKIRREDTSEDTSQEDSSTIAETTFSIPLAELVRPTSIEDFVGQNDVVGTSSGLYAVLQSGNVPSMIFWGPPGCGKTTLARIISNKARASGQYRFVQLSATTSGIKDVKEAIQAAKNKKSLINKKTILFVDEIHRFNKLQQDTFLPHVEDGTITLLGATTENPSFQVNSALLSRCKVIVLNKLQTEEIKILLNRALVRLGVDVVSDIPQEAKAVCIHQDSVTILAELCDGDGRIALNGLQLAVQTKRILAKEKQQSSSDTQSADRSLCILVEDIKECLQKTHLLYDRVGDEHYHSISALHKSIRGGDDNASLYWLSRMLCGGEDPLYVARRLIRCASEDIGLADPLALTQAVSAFNACQYIGMPECEVILAQAVIYLSRAPKSVEAYTAYEKAKSSVMNHKGPLPSVPLHLRSAPTKLMKDLGFGKGYKYQPDYSEPVEQTYLPDELQHLNFFE